MNKRRTRKALSGRYYDHDLQYARFRLWSPINYQKKVSRVGHPLDSLFDFRHPHQRKAHEVQRKGRYGLSESRLIFKICLKGPRCPQWLVRVLSVSFCLREVFKRFSYCVEVCLRSLIEGFH